MLPPTNNIVRLSWMIIIFSIAFVANIVLGQIYKTISSRGHTTNKRIVVTSFYPLFFITSTIGGDKITVVNITPAGAEPHDYEPTTQDIATIEQSNLLVINGAHLEPWADKITQDLASKRVPILEVAANLANQKMEDEGNQIQDPHVWLDPVLARQETELITNSLIEIDPYNTIYYRANEQKLLNDLSSLDMEFAQGLQNCKQTDIVTSHAAFGYLAAQYHLKQIPISGLSPDEEPTPKRLAQITQLAKSTDIKYIFFETLVSPKLAETIAKEIGASTIVFNPLEGLTNEEQSSGHNYFTIQKENLKNLRIALQCP